MAGDLEKQFNQLFSILKKNIDHATWLQEELVRIHAPLSKQQDATKVLDELTEMCRQLSEDGSLSQ